MERTGIAARELDVVDVYSCFPVVPEMVLRHLDLPATTVPSATGGHAAFGGPLSSYSLHAIASVTRRLRGPASLAATTVNRPGALLAVLTEIAVRGVDLTRIESRPLKDRRGEYWFFLDGTGHVARHLRRRVRATAPELGADVEPAARHDRRRLRLAGAVDRGQGQRPVCRRQLSRAVRTAGGRRLGRSWWTWVDVVVSLLCKPLTS